MAIPGMKGWTATSSGKVYDPSGKERKGTPVKGGTSDAEGKSNSRGHLKINCGEHGFKYVHRLVQAAMDGKDPGKKIVRHADDQKNGHNNKSKNLSTGSRADNAKDRQRSVKKKLLKAAIKQGKK